VVFTKKENTTTAQCIEILDWHHANGRNQSKTAKHFDPIYLNLKIKQPLVSAWQRTKQNGGKSGHRAMVHAQQNALAKHSTPRSQK
jgi:hypothetical protein